MTGLYLFAAAAGVPLLAWFLLGGGDEGAEGGDGSDGDGGIGGVMLRLLPLSTLAMVAAAFGVCGLVLGVAGAGEATTFIVAAVAGLAAGALNSTAFAYLRRSDSSAAVKEGQLAGAVGRVVMPIAADRRGRIAVAAGGQQIYLSAVAMTDVEQPAELEVGAPILVVEVRNGIAVVARLDAELTEPDD